MNDREIMENFIKTARAIAQLSDGKHFEVAFTDSNDKKQVIKVDLLSEDGTTEVEDKHHNECMQIALYSDENRKLKELLRLAMNDLNRQGCGNHCSACMYGGNFDIPFCNHDSFKWQHATEAEEFLAKTENFPAIDCGYYSPSDRKCTYGEEEYYCTEGPCEVWEQQREDRHD